MLVYSWRSVYEATWSLYKYLTGTVIACKLCSVVFLVVIALSAVNHAIWNKNITQSSYKRK